MTQTAKKQNSFTEGRIYGPRIRFALPVLGALFLQSLYGAVDLLVVGQFSTAHIVLTQLSQFLHNTSTIPS